MIKHGATTMEECLDYTHDPRLIELLQRHI
jgi:hypothetical protein